MDYTKLREKIREMQGEIIEGIQECIRIDSVGGEPEEGAPYGKGPKEALDFALNLGKTLGFRTANVDNKAGYVEMGERDSDLPAKHLPQTDADAQPEEHFQKKEMYEVLKTSISELRENEQLVLSLYYQKAYQMKEIAQVLGVSEPRVSQIHSNAIRKLRMSMQKYICGT